MQISYIGKYLVFGVSPTMIAHTKKQHLTPTYFPTSLHLYNKMGKLGSSKLPTDT